MDYSRFLNARSKARKSDLIRECGEIFANSSVPIISLAEGMPNPISFPFEEATITLRDGSKLQIDQALMNASNQYGPTRGYPPLVAWLEDFITKIYKPPASLVKPEEDAKGTSTCMISGAMNGICKAIEMLVNPGDNILVEAHAYAGTLTCLRPIKCNFLQVGSDEHGMIPESLSEILSPWKPEDALDPSSDIPRVLFIVPTGGNPTGVSLTTDRKRAIYAICHKYNLLILEDDPYYFLQYNTDVLPPTFLSLDEDGRVVRFDTFSKVLSAGLRLGFVTGPVALIKRIMYHIDIDTEHVSSFSQVLVHQLLKKWGIHGFLEHTQMCTRFYKEQRNHMLEAAEAWLKGIAEWNVPQAGLYLWIRLINEEDTKALMLEKALSEGVLLLPGAAFQPDIDQPSSYIRACYSFATKDEMNEGFQRLAKLLRGATAN